MLTKSNSSKSNSNQPDNPALKKHPAYKKAVLADRLRKKHALKQDPKKICLTMIAKNESKNMVRILDSVKPFIDMGVIVDTGSTDNTIEVCTNWAKSNNVTLKMFSEPFVDFAYNRTHAVKTAKEAFPEADYFLLSDADFVWEVLSFDKRTLVDHKYLIKQYNKAMSYWNIRLLSAKIDWSCECYTHEYWSEAKNQQEFNGYVRVNKLSALKIDDREDGGCKEDKYPRDERLCRKGLDDPKTRPAHLTRYKFYLAQTLKDMGRHEESIEWYTKRTLDKGWGEEVYYSYYQIGFNHERLGWLKKQVVATLAKVNRSPEEIELLAKYNRDNKPITIFIEESTAHFNEAAASYMTAYNYRKIRAESIYHLTRMYRMLGMSEKAYETANIGSKIAYPADETLFVEDRCYEYMFDYERTYIYMHFPDEHKRAKTIIETLVADSKVPDGMKAEIERNRSFYSK